MDQQSDFSGKDSKDKSESSSSCDDFKICSPCQPSSGGDSKEGGVQNSSLKSNFLLRSSVLSSSLTSNNSPTTSFADSQSKSFILNPPRLSNPFMKSGDDKDKVNSSTDIKPENKVADVSPEKVNDKVSSSSVSFVPLGFTGGSSLSSCTAAKSSLTAQSSSDRMFVFGQNLRDKVEGPKSEVEPPEEVTSSADETQENNVDEPKANGTTSEMLFTAALKNDSGEAKANESGKSLSEAAREYEEARCVKRKFEPVQLITGEEHEQNVLQMNCKLFAYDKISLGWQERGRGLLRLNDSPPVASRLIIRAHGSLRVLINTKVWSGMVVQRASPKSLRITAMDSSEQVKVFLISASQTEMDELQRYLETRVKKRLEMNNGNGHSNDLAVGSSSNQTKKLKSTDSS